MESRSHHLFRIVFSEIILKSTIHQAPDRETDRMKNSK